MSSRPITSCKRYAVSYRDLANKRHELGFYAIDAFEARQLAIEFNKFVREHPNSIDRISLRNKDIAWCHFVLVTFGLLTNLLRYWLLKKILEEFAQKNI